MRAAFPALALCLCAGAALAGPALPPQPPTTVSGLTVYPRTEPPKIVASFPAAGQALSAGVLVLSITFDQRMIATGFSFAAAPGSQMPPCLKTPRLLNDEKTFVLLCTTDPAKTYVLAFNAQTQDAANGRAGFQNQAEKAAAPATLTFTTTDGEGPRDIADALKQANLKPIDLPIQESPGFGLAADAKTSP